MTLPPCPIAGHDNPHHWHDALYPGVEQVCRPPHNYSDTDSGCLEDDPDVSRCYSAHVESAEPTADEWVRVDVDTMIPEGVDFSKTSTNTWRVHKGHGPVYVRRSDLDKLTPPDPAAILAAGLTKAGTDVWTAPDVRDVLGSTGLMLASRPSTNWEGKK